MERPVNRSQSPISTASPNAVNVEMPRGQPNRVTTGVNSLSAAISAKRAPLGHAARRRAHSFVRPASPQDAAACVAIYRPFV